MYVAAEALAAEVDGLLLRAKRHAPRQADHLERSADSVVLNMSEGIACYRPKMKVSAYEIARKEASEVRSILRRLAARRIFTDEEIRTALELAGACVGMLTSAIIAVERRPDPS